MLIALKINAMISDFFSYNLHGKPSKVMLLLTLEFSWKLVLTLCPCLDILVIRSIHLICAWFQTPAPFFNRLLQELVYQRKKFFIISLRVLQLLTWKTLVMMIRIQLRILIIVSLQVGRISLPFLYNIPVISLYTGFHMVHHLIWKIFIWFGFGKGSSKWVKVNEKRTLHDVLKEPNFIIQGIPGVSIISQLILCILTFYIKDSRSYCCHS